MKQFKISIIMFAIMSLLAGIVYPLFMTGIAQLAIRNKANGSLAESGGRIVGSWLLGQNVTGKGYFHGRPSANSYDGMNSGGSNFGPTNRKFVDQAAKLAGQVRKDNGLPPGAPIPAELVLASGSGLDPHIGVDAALIQAARIARERKIDESVVREIVNRNMELRYFGLFGDAYVNVLSLNMALDSLGTGK
jgi:potassium-transporting ATPase KdpC subunit